jgi:RND family efflux transporter MFP subunit
MHRTPELPKHRSRHHLLVAGLALGLLSSNLSGCEKALNPSVHAQATDNRPKVTVARPAVATISEFSEHTGRTEAKEAVELRARASGYLQKVSFREGELVKKGQLLFVIDPRPYQSALASAKAELESTRVDLELAHKNLARAEQLMKSGTITEREWDTRSAAVSQLAARGAVVSAAISSAELDLEYAYVRAPVNGRIGRTLVTTGNLVGPSLPTPLASIVSVDPLYVYIDIDETRAARLGREPGRLAQVGFPGEEGHPHQAKLDFVDNRVDPSTGTLRVRVVVDNADGRLSAGSFARVRLPETAAHEAVLVADRAVATDQDRRFVWVVDDTGKASYRAVKLGRIAEGLRIVNEGLSATDHVVVRGVQRVRPGALLAVDTVSMRDVDGLGSAERSAR